MLSSASSLILWLESCWCFPCFFPVNFSFQSSSVSQILCLSFRRRICDWVTLFSWPLNLQVRLWLSLTLLGDGDGQALDFKCGWGWSPAWPLCWCVAISLTPSSLGCLQNMGLLRRENETERLELKWLPLKGLLWWDECPLCQQQWSIRAWPSTILADSRALPKADPALTQSPKLLTSTGQLDCSFWEWKTAAHEMISHPGFHGDFCSSPHREIIMTVLVMRKLKPPVKEIYPRSPGWWVVTLGPACWISGRLTGPLSSARPLPPLIRHRAMRGGEGRTRLSVDIHSCVCHESVAWSSFYGWETGLEEKRMGRTRINL